LQKDIHADEVSSCYDDCMMYVEIRGATLLFAFFCNCIQYYTDSSRSEIGNSNSLNFLLHLEGIHIVYVYSCVFSSIKRTDSKKFQLDSYNLIDAIS